MQKLVIIEIQKVMNNMGGIIRCEVVQVSAVETFEVMNSAVRLTLKSGQSWETLTISTRQTKAVAPPEKSEAGTAYAHRFTTVLPFCVYRGENISFYRDCCRNRCLVRYTDANLRTRILGSKEFPLTGTFEEVPGETAADLAGYRLELEATCLHPQLIYKV